MGSGARAAARAQWLLGAGMGLGLAAAVITLVAPRGVLPPGVAARVDGRDISEAAWQRAVAAVAADRRTPLTAADRQRILERLVDEELLVQHGLALGLVESDRRLRGQLIQEVLAASAADIEEPDEATLRAYYARHRDYFSSEGRLHVTATRRDGVPATPPIPDTLLPAATLREYLGPRLTQVALELEPGAAYPDGEMILRVVRREPPTTPPFDAVRDEVRAAVMRDAETAKLQKLLAQLREERRVQIRKAP